MKKLYQVLDRSVLNRHTAISSWKSITLDIILHLSCWVLAYLGSEFSNWYLAPVSILIIGAIQHHTGILLHEGVHGMLHPNQKVNDFLNDVFNAVPFLTFQKNYKIYHLEHHRYSGDPDKDPEKSLYQTMGWKYDMSDGSFVFKMIFRSLLMINQIKFFTWNADFIKRMVELKKCPKVGFSELMAYIVFWAPVLFIIWKFGLWLHLFIFWFIPLTFVFLPLVLIHGIGEHTGEAGDYEEKKTITHHYGFITNFFLYPIKSGYHLEHHLFPNVPWYEMEGFYKDAIKNEEYKERATRLYTNSYFFGEHSISKVFKERDTE